MSSYLDRRYHPLSVVFVFVFPVLVGILLTPWNGWPAQPKYEIKLATLAPENSSLTQIFNEMNRELLEQTKDQVGFKIYTGFALGDEADVLRKLRIGLVNAAAFTTGSLTDINPDLRVLQFPFLFNDYREVDYILDKLGEDLMRGFSTQGYEVLGWTELGFIYMMSMKPIAQASDLQGQRVWAVAGSPMTKVVFDRAGVSPVTINAPDVLVGLQTNLLDVVYNSPYYALVTQWYSKVKYLTDLPLFYGGGVLLIDKKIFAKLPPDLQETTKRVCAKYMRQATERTRKDNADALRVIFQRGVTRVTPNSEQVAGFKQLAEDSMGDLSSKYLPRDVIDKAKKELEQFRSGSQGKP